MDNRFKYIFLSFSLLIFLVGLMVWYANTYSSFKPVEREFSINTNYQITRIEIKNQPQDYTIVLEPLEMHRWQLNRTSYANESAVEELLSLLRRLTIQQPVSIEESPMVHQMFQQQGIQVTVYIVDYHIRIAKRNFLPYERIHQSFIIGGDVEGSDASYVKKVNSDLAFRVHAPGYDRGMYRYFNTGIHTWRDPVVIDIAHDDIEYIRVEIPSLPQESFLLKPSSNRSYTFYSVDQNTRYDHLTLNMARVERFASSFKGLHFEALLDEYGQELRKSTMFDSPFIQLAIKPVYGEEIALTAFRRSPSPDDTFIRDIDADFDPNRFYLQLADGEFAQAQYYVFSRVFRPLSFFVDNP